ncbi:NADP-dependent oxidoreductase [Hoeflea sp. WL0058]|uniref:NADP-dependent oxidoreductase n=1 Tax=Flavimaribacter sediminis TaxID=2865987 RepID=A0AAE3D032_9HYPH|nr:NADP-dependent oxidoreductase [Flavimaribacter sediminis]MBW8636336.1 NADP-dependent oxidoreductase [Flavimaribacter sediminis]
MKRIQYFQYGNPEELSLADVDQPKPGPGQILVRVKAASVNPMDWKIRRGEMKMMTGSRFPRGLGHDFSGVVDAVGPEVKRFKVGDEVFGAAAIRQAGAFAEYLVADEKNVGLKPTNVTFEQAAAMTVIGSAAWISLMKKAKLRAGQSVLITGCLGSVGRLALQIARTQGAAVTGSCRESGLEEAQALGVSEVIDYRAFNIGSYRGRFDVIFDTAGALSLRECGSMLKKGGMSLHIVPTPAKMIGALLSSRHHVVIANPTPESFAGIAEGLEHGTLVPMIGRVVPLSEAIPAIVELEKAGVPKGKLVIAPME